MSELALRAEGLGKRYRRGYERRGTLIEWLRGRASHEWFWALEDVSFEVRRGEMLGIVGRNGAGKSTLLRILSRITRPTEGRAFVPQRIGSLLDVGTGFHPELTGRENIYLNGALLRMSRAEIRATFDEIVEFSGVGEFLDTPLKRYSSGMKVRLGFSVAVHLRQEMMLVDEVLSVGDAAFREKCLERMDRLTHDGHTVLFVGHNMELIASACQRAVWLDEGRVRAAGPAGEIVKVYQEQAAASGDGVGLVKLDGLPGHDGELLDLTHLRLLDGADRQVVSFASGQRVRLAVGYVLHEPTRQAELSISAVFVGAGGSRIATCDSRVTGRVFHGLPRRGEFVCELGKLPLMPGLYRLGLQCRVDGSVANHLPTAARLRVTPGEFYASAALPPPGSGSVLFDHDWFVRAAELER